MTNSSDGIAAALWLHRLSYDWDSRRHMCLCGTQGFATQEPQLTKDHLAHVAEIVRELAEKEGRR
jgi:hypothetical protein